MQRQAIATDISMRVLQALLVTLSIFVLPSCDKDDPNAERKESIEVYKSLEALNDPETDPGLTFAAPVTGGDFTLYVKSNVEFSAEWQDSYSSPWCKINSCESAGDGIWTISMTVKPRSQTSAYYTKRTGMLMLKSPELYFGSYITVHQGLYTRFSSDFSWMKYGSDSPDKLDGTLMDSWSATIKGYGYSSTVINGEDKAYVYGKNGYIMLGDDEGHGADFFTPYVDNLRNDSLLVVSFRAVAYVSKYGIKDNNKFTVEVTGGGEIRDFADEGVTSMEIEVPYYDVNDEDYPTSMWDGETEFLIGVISTDRNPITANTRIRFLAGELGQMETNNRIFIDNMYIRRIYFKRGDYEDEDLFLENGGSGIDRLLGQQTDTDDQND